MDRAVPYRRAILIAGGRHPFEQWPLAAATVTGAVAAAVPAVRPASLTATMPEPLLIVWLAMMSASGLLGLVGGHWRGEDVNDGLLVEAVGVLWLACMCSLYVLALIARSPATALTAGGLLAGLGIGAWHRAGQIMVERRRIARARRELADLPPVDEPGNEQR